MAYYDGEELSELIMGEHVEFQVFITLLFTRATPSRTQLPIQSEKAGFIRSEKR